MKKITALILIAFLFSSCEWKIKKTSELESLLDYGFLEEVVTEVEKISSSTPAMFKSNSSTHYGIDISHYQGDLISQLDSHDSLRFVICKATQGDYYVDPMFRTNWNEIKQKGLIRGAYHFYSCNYDPIQQADHFVTNISDIESTDIAPVLDIEQGSMSTNVSGPQMVKDILSFLKRVELKLDRKPILYTDYAFAQEYLTDSEFSNYDLWLAEYTGSRKPKIPETWKEKGYKIWQKSASYHDHSKTIDLDVYYGVLNEIVK